MDSFECRQIILRDTNGRPKLVMTATEGGANVSLFNNRGITRMALNVAEDMCHVDICDNMGNLRARLGVLKDPFIILSDEVGDDVFCVP